MLRRLIRPSDHRVMPWKNGQGMTAEIAIDPPDADLASGFRWRLSIADVGADGPFSAFPGYDRTLMLIAGKGMELRFADGRIERVDRCFEPFAFRGEDALDGRLIEGPVRDFNLMVRRETVAAAVKVLTLEEGRRHAPPRAPGATAILHLLEGRAILDDGSALAGGDTLVIENGEEPAMTPVSGAARLFQALLTPRR